MAVSCLQVDRSALPMSLQSICNYIFIYFFKFFIGILLQLSHFFPLCPPLPSPPPTPTVNPTPLSMSVIHTCSLTSSFPFFPSLFPSVLPLPLWLLSLCSMFPCLWFYFACQLIFVHWVPLTGEIMWCVFRHLADFTQHNALQFQPCCCKGQELLLSFAVQYSTV